MPRRDRVGTYRYMQEGLAQHMTISTQGNVQHNWTIHISPVVLVASDKQDSIWDIECLAHVVLITHVI